MPKGISKRPKRSKKTKPKRQHPILIEKCQQVTSWTALMDAEQEAKLKFNIVMYIFKFMSIPIVVSIVMVFVILIIILIIRMNVMQRKLSIILILLILLVFFSIMKNHFFACIISVLLCVLLQCGIFQQLFGTSKCRIPCKIKLSLATTTQIGESFVICTQSIDTNVYIYGTADNVEHLTNENLLKYLNQNKSKTFEFEPKNILKQLLIER